MEDLIFSTAFYIFDEMKSLVLLLLVSKCAFSQINLVPNGDFEQFKNCTLVSYINNLHNWFNPYLPVTTAEYYNTCNPYPCNSPNNYLGNQNPNSGNGYAGIDIYTNGLNIREYLEVELLDSLTSGLTYCVSFYVSLAETRDKGADRIGAYFSQDSVTYSSPPWGVLNLPAQIQNPSGNVIIDTINWLNITGEFIAVGGERFITIGNFKTDANTQTISQSSAIYSYFYIDDVSVTEGSCNVDIDDESSTNFTIQVFPNPVKNNFQITIPEMSFTNLKYQVYAIDGSMIQDGILQRNNVLVQSVEWQSGLYLVQVFDNDGHSSTVRVLKL